MSGTQARARVTVTVTVEFDVAGVWGSDCSLSQVHEQARESAINTLSKVFDLGAHTVPSDALRTRARARLVGAPKVEAVIVEVP